MESRVYRSACVGGDRWAVIIDVSCGCMYSSAFKILCKAYSDVTRMCRRHSVGIKPIKARLRMEHVSLAD